MVDLATALQSCCACATKADNLNDDLRHLVLHHQNDVTILLSVAAVCRQEWKSFGSQICWQIEHSERTECLLWLRLLKALFGQESSQANTTSVALFGQTLLKLPDRGDAKITPAALELLLMLVTRHALTQSRCEDGCSSEQELMDELWRLIDANLQTTRQPAADMYRVWVRWLTAASKLEAGGRMIEIVSNKSYISHIKTGLQSRSQETQKLCLFIFRQSAEFRFAQSFEPEGVREQGVRQVNRYCRAFETINMGGYAKQASECLRTLSPELLSGTDDSSVAVDSSWWILLVSMSLRTTKSDSIRRNVGNWLLRHEFVVQQNQIDFATFLCTVFLPWAYQAQQFLSSTGRQADVAHCAHGEQLNLFVSRLLSNTETPNTTVRMVLQSLTAESVSSYSYTYVLTAVIGWFQDSTFYAHEVNVQEELENLHFHLSTKALTNSQRKRSTDLITALVHETQTDVFDKSLPPSATETPSVTVERDISTVLRDLDDRALQSNGLLETCLIIQSVLRSNPQSFEHGIQANEGRALRMLWEESSRRRHPREVILLLCDVLVSQPVMRVSDTCDALLSVVSDAIRGLLELAQTRMYVWMPLTSRIHRAFMLLNEAPHVVEIIETFVRLYIRRPPIPTQEYLLDCAVKSFYDEIRGTSKSTHLVLDDGLGHAYVFDLLNRLPERHILMAQRLFDFCLMPWLKSNDKKKTLVALQSALLLGRHLIANGTALLTIVKPLWLAIKSTKSPRYMYILEFAIVTTFWHAHGAVEALALADLDEFEEDIEAEALAPREIASRLKIYVSFAKHPDIGVAFIARLICYLPAFCASPRIAVRFEGLYTMIKLMEMAQSRGMKEINDNKAYQRLSRHAESLLNLKGLPESRRKEEFDPCSEQTLLKIFQGDYLQLEDDQHVLINTTHFHTIEQTYQQDQVTLPPGVLPIGQHGEQANEAEEHSIDALPDMESLDMTYQSKYIASLNVDILQVPTKQSHEVILVASLIDSPYNLGGLCRAAEIYACSELHIPKLSITKDRAFTSVSVSSESHIHIVETPVVALVQFLQSKRNDGFAIVGIEQTDSSMILGATDTKLPAKSVILMGAEKTGISADLLVECDMCVELKQWGTTRSLNVQTAAATVLYEWRKQYE